MRETWHEWTLIQFLLGIIFDKFKVVHHNGPLPMPFKKLCRNVNWLPPDVVPPYLTTPQAPHMGLGRPVRKTTPPKRFVPRNPQMAAPGAVRGQGADLDFMMFRYNVPKEASTELRRGRNLRFIKWMGAQMDAKDYPLDADADLDDWLMARGKYAVRTQYGMVTTEQRVVSLNDAALRLTYYHTVIPGPPVGVPGGTKRR